MRSPSAAAAAVGSGLVKTQIAGQLREKILNAELKPGEIVSETYWGQHFGAAQASVREAINLLEREGLVQKQPGRSARVTKLSQKDVIEAYQVRTVLEGLAARLIAEQGMNVNELEARIDEMRESARQGDLPAVIAADEAFHLGLADLSGNPVLARQIRQLLIPLFAFTLIRALANPGAPAAWAKGVDDHRLILTGIRTGDPVLAEQTARHVVGKFVATAQEVWATDPPPDRGADAAGEAEGVHEDHRG